jgi:hypothetical protein
MKKSIPKRRVPLPPLEAGQVWRMADSHLQVGLVGKALVHYKHFKGQLKRSPVSLSSKEVLMKFLRANKATLVRD